MIISQRRQVFDGRTIKMPRWMLAPLYLQRGATCWLAHRPAQTSRRNTIYELILTSIDRSHWPHLWKLKLTTADEAGIAERLCGLLADRDIEILTAESSVHSINRYNSMSFILSMANYKHDIDGDHEVFDDLGESRIDYLELALLSTVGGQLVFHRSGRPRFEFAPIRLYSQLSTWDFDTAEGSLAEATRIYTLKDTVCEAIRRECKSQQLFYAGAVDTENRAIRILFFPAGDRGVVHLQLSCAELNATVLAAIFQQFKRIPIPGGKKKTADANVIRFQVRRGQNASSKPILAQLERVVGPGQIDLTFESTSERISASELKKIVEERLLKNKLLVEHGIDVTCGEF